MLNEAIRLERIRLGTLLEMVCLGNRLVMVELRYYVRDGKFRY